VHGDADDADDDDDNDDDDSKPKRQQGLLQPVKCFI
jgi:hypothetical protein